MKGQDWSDAEVAAIVADYLQMRQCEAEGTPYSKAAHRRALTSSLDGRSDKAIEFKYANVSSVLADLGLPYIVGYKPLNHRQAKLEAEVRRQLGLSQRRPG